MFLTQPPREHQNSVSSFIYRMQIYLQITLKHFFCDSNSSRNYEPYLTFLFPQLRENQSKWITNKRKIHMRKYVKKNLPQSTQSLCWSTLLLVHYRSFSHHFSIIWAARKFTPHIKCNFLKSYRKEAFCLFFSLSKQKTWDINCL